MIPIPNLDDRQWTQIRAALLFWRSVAQNSRRHPCHHPQVKDLFKHFAPLTIDEIDRLLNETPQMIAFNTTSEAARITGLTRQAIERKLRAMGVRPAFARHASVYRVEDLNRAVEACLGESARGD